APQSRIGINQRFGTIEAWLPTRGAHRDDEDESCTVSAVVRGLSGRRSEYHCVRTRKQNPTDCAGEWLEPGTAASRFEGTGRVGGRNLSQDGHCRYLHDQGPVPGGQ